MRCPHWFEEREQKLDSPVQRSKRTTAAFSLLALNRSYDSGKSLRSDDRERRGAGSLARDATDALDYFGYWKWFDALLDAAFYDRNRHVALGDTPEQRFMGKWSDGTPVTEPEVELAK